MQYHVKSVHEGKKIGRLNLPCPHCDGIFGRRASLYKHLKTIHGKEYVKTETYDHEIKSEPPDNVYETENHNEELEYLNLEYPEKETFEDKERSLIEINGLKQETDVKLFESAKDNENDPFKDLQSNFLEKEGDQSKDHKCDICSYSSVRKNELARHISSVHEKNKPHKCLVCDYSCSANSTLKIHVESVHEGKKPFHCSFCDYSCSINSTLKNHVESVHERKKPFRCSICDARFSRKSSMKIHIREVHEKTLSHTCQICSYSSARKTNLKEHIERVHEGKTSHTCHICSYSSARNQSDLSRHISMVHEKNKPHTCSMCDSSFAVKSSLTRHIVEVHEENNQKKFMCHLCSSGFTRETALKNHILIHEGKRPFKYKENEEIGGNKCPWCFSVFQEKDDLSKHIDSAHQTELSDEIYKSATNSGAQFMCHLCSREFTRKTSLEKHMLIHEGKRPFKCSICTAAFHQKGSLDYHIKTIHLKDDSQKHICEICGFTTLHLSSLKIHTEKHQRGKKSHQCHICSARFNLACAMRRHIKRDHTDDPSVEKPYHCDKCNAKYSFPRSLKKHKMAAHEGKNNIETDNQKKNSDFLLDDDDDSNNQLLQKESEDKLPGRKL